MGTIHTEGSEKTRTIWAMTESDAMDNAIRFLRTVADDGQRIGLDA
ncbi:hypothetical protein [Roseospira marina]|nr:hypothetical protein [Roseospira marina]MBB4314608.1 hypothetical protein [Roseospira marina]MBB5088787.1 hypothetical protein [Roseospira marina]